MIALGGCKKKGDEEMETGELPDITGKKVVMVIASKNFRDEELFEPKEIIEKAGGNVTVASSSLNISEGMKGGTSKPDVLLNDVKADDFDAVVFVGGSGASEYWKNPTAHALAKAAADGGKLVCAICIAPVTLANAGLLDGKNATVWKSERGVIKKKGARYTGEDVEVDGKFITADGPKSAAKFGRAIVRALAE
jgi:protease I